ncbi:SDR family NAD(P)-dependent oxidoreductase [Rhizobium alvei]|uniref:SDR family oxidoreductase n=1 Tax=Rhizobium alvei TaxID=1132659 RepID=A0ABT8YG23_9HYPH|nr:SDR family oxidoreductase [Rhizobium alvei]MDO6962626.1 SDR family oxidoreductase [Rhizobium alvei]
MANQPVRYPDLENASILITGGASGIGAALVESFCAQGARVAFIDRDREAAERLCRAIAEAGLARPAFHACDLRDIERLRAIVDMVAEDQDGLRVLVNNAGFDERHDYRNVSPDYWDDNQNINLRPVFFSIQAAAPHMKANGGGSIISFSSIAYMMNLPGMPSYLTAKAAIIGLTKGMAGELGPDGIRVNAILPGMVLTERQKRLWINDEAAASHRARQCLDRSLGPEDMVGPCLFLASNASSAITAQSLIVDGGYM